jgi:glycosyltransferase involved in cell wall biosynthesis
MNVIFVGGLDPFRKGIYDVLKALPMVIGTCKNVYFTFTGGDNVRYALGNSLDPLFTPWVSFRGWISEAEKAALYSGADLLLLPSHEEGVPYVIVEAMAAGLPIIATPVGAIPEVIEEGINGFLINPGDYEALAQRIVRLCQDEELRLQIGHTNREKARRLYRQDVIFQELEAIYDQLMTRNMTRRKSLRLSDSKHGSLPKGRGG